LWWYVWSVIVAAGAVTVVSVSGLHGQDMSLLAHSPVFWLVVAPMVVMVLCPVVPKGRAGDGTFALVFFLFVLLVHVGLAAVVALSAVTMALRGIVYRQAVHRNLFNVGQHVLTLFACWGVLRAFSIDPTPSRPWAFSEPRLDVMQFIAVALAGVAYLVVNNGSVYVAVAMIESRPLARVVRGDIHHLVVVLVAMVTLAPLVLVVMVHLWLLVPLFYPPLAALYHNATMSAVREHDALHDSLTGLGNRELLHREGSKAIDDLGKPDDGLAIMVLDLDKFKDVNDTLGHAAGDQLLRIVTERLLAAVRPDDVVARLGGDEFVVVVRDVPDTTVARLAAVRLLERVIGACQIDGVSITIAASLGVAVAPTHGHEFDALLRRADRAMYVAKSSGCGVAMFDPARDDAWRRPVFLDQPLGASRSSGD